MSKLRARLTDPARSGVYRVRRPDEVLQASTSLDLARVDLAGARSKEDVLAKIAAALGFPDWFGNNWDALEDCLTDLSWRDEPREAMVLLFENAASSDALGILIDVLRAAAEHWAGRRRPFFAVFVDPDARLAVEPLFREK